MPKKAKTDTPPVGEIQNTQPAAPQSFTQEDVDRIVAQAVAQSRIRPTRKICILGTTPSRMQAPMLKDPSWEIWTIGPGGKDANRWDILFELHGSQTWPKGFRRQVEDLAKTYHPGCLPPGAIEKIHDLTVMAQDGTVTGPSEGFDQYIKELSEVEPAVRICGPGHQVTKCVVTMEKMPGWKSNEVYPYQEIIKKYGRLWMSSSISYCIALAIEFGATDIALFGIDLESSEEYQDQFEGCRALMDIAKVGMGINLYLPPGCGLLRDPNPYPHRWETDESLYHQNKIVYLEGMLRERQTLFSTLAAEVQNGEGQLKAFRHVLAENPYCSALVEPLIKQLEPAVAERTQRHQGTMMELQRIEGEIDYAKHTIKMFTHKGVSKPHSIAA